MTHDHNYRWNLINKQTRKQNTIPDSEMKKKLTVTRVEVGVDIGEKERGFFRNMEKVPGTIPVGGKLG